MHIGQNISKVRGLLGIKQETVAASLKISQQTLSRIEQSAHLNESSLERIAGALGVPAKFIIEFDEQIMMRLFIGQQVLDSTEKDKLLYTQLVEKIIELYERLLQSKQQ